MRPLEAIRVLDLTRVLSGPYCTMLLADLGAEVIKVERPGAGDDTRSWGPPWMKDASGRDTAESAYYLSVNRNKKSVTLDISKPEGQGIARELADKCHVLIENYKVGTLQKYGLGYEKIKTTNPSIIYCSVTGFGQDGPYAPRPGYDFIFQGMGGLMSITGERDGQPGAGPQKVGIPITDVLTGMYASVAILAAIAHRERSGQGQYIDSALLDTMVAFNANQIVSWFASGKIPVRWGNAHAQVVPYEVFPTADGHIILAVGNDSQFAKFCEVAGKPGWTRDSRFAQNANRVRHRATLVPLIAELLRNRTQLQWLDALEPLGVPCGPINRLDAVFADPQLVARGLKSDLPHPTAGIVPQVGAPMKFMGTPLAPNRPPPLLGEHTVAVLRERLQLSDAAIAQLADEGVIAVRGV